jgi:excisionase family DNA binding protein
MQDYFGGTWMDNNKKVLTPEDVAREAGVCRRTVYSLLKRGKIQHVRAGEKYLISRANFEKWLSGEQLKTNA